MKVNLITGVFRRLLLGISISLMLMSAGCSRGEAEEQKPAAVSVQADEMLAIPWNEGWSVAVSVTPGIPIELHGSGEIKYDLSGDTQQMWIEQAGELVSLDKAGTTRKAEERLYWNPVLGNPPKQLDDIETSWIRLVRKQEGHPTGLVLVKFSPSKPEDTKSGPTFKAEIVASLAFPQKDGTYQSISDKELQELAETYQK
ncbi:hypothetical protein [Gorillibacterium sp. sgz500922]|uniref:hypothetical protein n=1 Tax=Gorillibacterium sp. sgz500922 TaxID=3446694 RepID=UPI003F66B4C6